MQKMKININADLGEMAGQDELLMPYLQSCNIATGGHVGDKKSMLETIELAQQHQVKIGAHPSYPDKENFGRRTPKISDGQLKDSLKKQVNDFYEIAAQKQTEVHHIKPHGALYHDLIKEEHKAELFLTILEEMGLKTSIYTLKYGFLHQLAQFKHKIYFEAFIDRKYKADLNLVHRKEKNALIYKPEIVWKQLASIHFDQRVKVDSGEIKAIDADTYCLHGDHPNAVEILQYIDRKMERAK